MGEEETKEEQEQKTKEDQEKEKDSLEIKAQEADPGMHLYNTL